MKKLTTWLSLALLLGAVTWATPNPYETIDKPTQADEICRGVQQALQQHFGLRLRQSVAMHLVPDKELDALLQKGPYKGAEVGLYTGVENGRHQVYVMQGWSRDMCSGITAHELAHAWQEENVPPNQDVLLREGFARWVEYKYYDCTGAYTYCDRIRRTQDPVYGVGFYRLLALEDTVGANKVADMMRRAVKPSDLPAKGGKQ